MTLPLREKNGFEVDDRLDKTTWESSSRLLDTWFRLIGLLTSLADCSFNFSSCTVDFGVEIEADKDDWDDKDEGNDDTDVIWSYPRRRVSRVLRSSRSSDSCCATAFIPFFVSSSLLWLLCPDSCDDASKFNWREPLRRERFDWLAADLETMEGTAEEANEGIFDLDEAFGVTLVWSLLECLPECLSGVFLWGSRVTEDDLLDSFERLIVVMDDEDRVEGVLLNRSAPEDLCCCRDDDDGEEVTNDEEAVCEADFLFETGEVLATEGSVFLTFVVVCCVTGLFCCPLPVWTAVVSLLINFFPDAPNEVDLEVDEEDDVGGNNGVDFELGRPMGVELKAVKKQEWTSTPASLSSLALMMTLLACLHYCHDIINMIIWEHVLCPTQENTQNCYHV